MVAILGRSGINASLCLPLPLQASCLDDKQRWLQLLREEAYHHNPHCGKDGEPDGTGVALR